MARSPLFHILQKLLNSSIQLESPSRRNFVKAALATGTAFVLPPPFIPLYNRKPIAILGAGAAGLAAAYQLTKLGLPFEIFEATSRHGGRVLTKYNFNSENMFCELGGELIDSNHRYLFQLAEELDVEMENFAKQGLVNQAFFFDNRFFNEEDLREDFAKLVSRAHEDLERIFQGQTQKTIDYRTHSELAKYYDHMTLEAYLSTLTNIDPYILDLVRVAYVCEFGQELHGQSALNFLLMMLPEYNATGELYGKSDEGWRVRSGNSNLMTALYNSIKSQGDIHHEHRLVEIRETDSKIRLTFDCRGIAKEKTFEHVICTIPFSVFKDIDGFGRLNLSERKRLAIRSFAMGYNTKLISGFTDRFWTYAQENSFQGQLCTQFDSQFFWDTSRDQDGRSGILTNYLGGARASLANDSTFATTLKDFSKLFPEAPLRMDGNTAMANWMLNPLTQGSYACPSPGMYTTFYGSLALPELKNKLFFAGEHTSESSLGYINGALESGRDAAVGIADLLSRRQNSYSAS